MIDDRRDLVTRADFHELRRHLCLFPDVDRNDLVREPSFLEHHSGLVAVVRRPGVAIDHSFLPMKRLSEVCRIYPEFASARQFGAGNKIPHDRTFLGFPVYAQNCALANKTAGRTAMTKLARPLAFVLMTATMATGSAAFAEDTLRLTVGQRGLWDTSISDVGQRAGIFKKHGVTLELLYTQGSGETQQAVFAGSVDIGVSVGVMGALAAYAKGAPVRIIGNEITGAGDLYWYVKSDSPIKTIKDFDGKTIAFSTVGASTHGVVTAFIKQYGLTAAKPTQTGGPAPTLTAVMSGQVDVGWAAPPFGLDQLDRKEIRQIATGNDTTFKGQSIRLVITNQQTLQNRKDAIVRFMKAYRESIDWMYSDPAALKTYAEFAGIAEAKAKRIRDYYFPKSVLSPDKIVGVDLIMPEAVDLKFIPAPLTKEELAELIQIPPRN